jgi:MFS family permease
VAGNDDDEKFEGTDDRHFCPARQEPGALRLGHCCPNLYRNRGHCWRAGDAGVLIVPFENEFHWSRATISFAIGVNLLVYGLVGPFAAAAMDRFGVRRTMALSLGVAAAGVALSPLVFYPWQLVLLWGLVVGCPPALSVLIWQLVSPRAGSMLGRGWLSAF